jgi:hypothetical protein
MQRDRQWRHAVVDALPRGDEAERPAQSRAGAAQQTLRSWRFQ